MPPTLSATPAGALLGLAPAGAPNAPGSVLSAAERRRITRRLASALLALGLLGLGTLLLRLEPDQWQVAELIRALAALVVGAPTLILGLRGLAAADARGATDQLVGLAILAAAATGDFVAATLIPLLLELGRVFEDRSSLGARAAIDAIRRLAARDAVRWRDGAEERVGPDQLRLGDEILVRPGERLAVDGTVLEGRSAVDNSAITGEADHFDVAPGSPVFAGAVVIDGMLRVRVRGSGADTILGRVVNLLAELERAATPAQRLFERRAGAWLPLVLTIAATVLFFTEDLARAIAVLVAATPTALVVSGPAALVAAMTAAARLRILIKSSDFLERAAEVDTLILDKTGTVTLGAPMVAAVVATPGVSEEALVRAAATCGFGSRHPVSRALVREATRRRLAITAPSAITELPGQGVKAVDGERSLVVGRRGLLTELGLEVGPPTPGDASEVWVAADAKLLGRLVLRDEPRPEAGAALAALRSRGIERILLLTGDRRSVAEEVGAALQVDEVVAEVLPEQKLDVVRREQAAGRVVMMVGDGVNDVPALAGADVGVAIGAEVNEVALGGADVALMGSDLARIPQLLDLATRARRALGYNLGIAFGLSAGLITMAALGLLTPLTAAVAQSAAVMVVVVNGARLLRFEASSPSPADPAPPSSQAP